MAGENDLAETQLYVWIQSLTPLDPAEPVEVDVYAGGPAEFVLWTQPTKVQQVPYGEDGDSDGRMDPATRLDTLTETHLTFTSTVYVEVAQYRAAADVELYADVYADAVATFEGYLDLAKYSPMQIDALAMAFNHDPGNAGGEGLNMRVHAVNPEIIAPEWYTGDLPTPSGNDGAVGQRGVLYLRSNSVTVYSRIAVSSYFEGLTIKMKAAGKDGADPLAIGNLNEVTFVVDDQGVLQPQGGVNGKTVNGIDDFAEFAATGTTAASVKREEATFSWEVTYIGADATNGNATGSNQAVVTDPIMMYTILNTPGDPWDLIDTADNNTQMPWKTVLDTVTRETYLTDSNGNDIQWGGGATTVEEVAERITRAIFFSQRFVYDPNSTNYYEERSTGTYFGLTAYHNQITGAGGPDQVNCWGTAWGVVVLSNLLGDSLRVMRLGSDFTTNPVSPIGSDPDNDSSWTAQDWIYHAVAWRGTSTSGTVYDACLMVDGDSDPATQPPRTPVLPAGMAWTDYRARLTSESIALLGFDAAISEMD